MMRRFLSRFLLMCMVLLAMCGLLVYQLGTLTLKEGATLSEQAEQRRVRTMSVKGERGSIMDRNGIVLAYSETCYNVTFLRDADSRTDLDSAAYTESLLKAIRMIEAAGGQTIDTSYIQMDDNGDIVYEWGVTSEAAIKSRYKNFCDAMGFIIKEADLNDLSKWPTAEYAYLTLRDAWYIPEELTFEDAIKVISIRQEVNLNNYRAYEPITIAYDVSLEVAAEIQMHSDDLPGLSVEQSSQRIYPRGEVACHILGYMSKSADNVTAATLKALGFTPSDYIGCEALNSDKSFKTNDDGDTLYDMTKMGYSYSDYIGVSGIERTMEAYLTGCITAHQGSRIVEVNKNGSIIREISSSAATDGDDVMLTIDIEWQVRAETALKNLIAKISSDEMALIAADDGAEYTKATNGDLESIDTAKTGAIVVMDVNSGQVLAMASYPGFDPNWFISGLTTEQSAYLFTGDDAADTTPLRNKAISQKLAPGSIYKMVTGIAGLAENVITIDETIDDKSPYIIINTDGSKVVSGAPSCWQKRTSKHANQDIVKALTNSCNYYFFEVSNRLGIDRLNKWSEMFGLTASTGIELPGETVGIIGGQQVLFDNTLDPWEQATSIPNLVYRQLCDQLKQFLTSRSMEIDEDAVKVCAQKLMALQDGSMVGKGPQIRKILSDQLGLPEGVTQEQPWVALINNLLNEIQWKATLTIRSGIGQGVSLVTPIAVARYVSAIANEGTVYEAHIVDRVLNNDGVAVKVVEPVVYNKIEIDPNIWTAVKRGLEGVVSPEDQGTAAKSFSEYFRENYIDRIAGKTGSAETTSKIDIENTSWFITFTPRENAEIAIVVCIPDGLSGSSSVSAIEEMLTDYFQKEDAEAVEDLVDVGAVTP